ncbi:hypothetical protein WMY93_000268 [Mugilogobius chulae]|uniref:Uncharacterized protein n=1 Tax=Mugilogobius chulae TaxID=88201 RepID=A0AAW0Q8S4_9GOBI
MSLRSGKNYLKEYEQQDEAEVQAEPDVSPHDGATLDQSKPADQPSPEGQHRHQRGSNRHLHAARGPRSIQPYSFNPLAHTFQPTNKSKVEPDGAQGFANYLIRKELVSTGLLQFDDKPENYWAWKASFVSATKDLNLSAREEQDLLTKWLGPKSSEQAKRIRAVHTLNPAAGVKMIWERLEESYGSSEAIEDALLRKIEEFPKLTNKDGDRLRELGDILLELNCASLMVHFQGSLTWTQLEGTSPGPTPVPKTDTSQSPATEEQTESPPAVVSKCTEVCGQSESPRSCSKICLVKAYPEGQKDRALNMYAVIDEQSNRSLAKTEFFNLFEIKTTPAPYTLKTCSGKAETTGRRAVDFIIESMDGKTNIKLPPLIECDSVPDDRSEIPSPEIAQHHPHLLPIANKIQPVDHHAPILLLLGRDILSVHKVVSPGHVLDHSYSLCCRREASGLTEQAPSDTPAPELPPALDVSPVSAVCVPAQEPERVSRRTSTPVERFLSTYHSAVDALKLPGFGSRSLSVKLARRLTRRALEERLIPPGSKESFPPITDLDRSKVICVPLVLQDQPSVSTEARSPQPMREQAAQICPLQSLLMVQRTQRVRSCVRELLGLPTSSSPVSEEEEEPQSRLVQEQGVHDVLLELRLARKRPAADPSDPCDPGSSPPAAKRHKSH